MLIEPVIETTLNISREVTSVNANSTIKVMVKHAWLTMHANLDLNFTNVGATIGVSAEEMENTIVK